MGGSGHQVKTCNGYQQQALFLAMYSFPTMESRSSKCPLNTFLTTSCGMQDISSLTKD